jgi:hypothetical protein
MVRCLVKHTDLPFTFVNIIIIHFIGINSTTYILRSSKEIQPYWRRGSSVSVVTRIRAGRSGFDSSKGEIFFCATVSRTALGLTQPPIQWVSNALSPKLKRQGREADHSAPPSTVVKNTWNYTSTPMCFFGVELS